jgi:hypothetical protein
MKYTSWWISGRLCGPRAPSRPWQGWRATGRPTGPEPPRNPLLLALVLHHFEEEIYFVRPPLAAQRVIFGLLARVARLLGYRAEYPYPYARHSETSRAGM